jgi:phytoene synthase
MSVAVLARGGRSFRLAGRLLPGDTLEDAAALYAFCRGVDDLADESANKGQAQAGLLALRQALLSGDSGHAPARPFLALQERCGVSARPAATLIDTVLGDLRPVRLTDEAALLDYAYGAAGTVGEMMCAVLGVPTAQALPYAVDLGMAMQLTNIARDVVEDAARGRLYLPATWLPSNIDVAAVAERPDAVFPAVRHLLARADRLYRSGEHGYQLLPKRVRPAIQAASRLYEEIGSRILRSGPGYLAAGRCVVPMPRKLALVAGCWLGAASRTDDACVSAPALPRVRA